MSCNKNIYTVISKDKDLSTLKTLIDLAGLKKTVKNLKCATFFAPVNAAFLVNGNTCLAKYLVQPENRDTLRNVLLYHITGKPYLTTDLIPASTITMKNNVTLFILAALYYPYLPTLVDKQNASAQWEIIVPNISTDNYNYIQKINGVLLPGYIPYPIGVDSEQQVALCL